MDKLKAMWAQVQVKFYIIVGHSLYGVESILA